MKTKAAILDEMLKRRSELNRFNMRHDEYFDACIGIMFDIGAEILATFATRETNGKGPQMPPTNGDERGG